MSFIVRTMFDGYGRDGRRSYNKGGGGSSGQVYYANQDKLLGTQADIATNMYNVYADNAPQRLAAMGKMADEAMDGTLADRARAQAGADAGVSLGTSLAAAQRGMERYGTTFNPNAVDQNLTNAALSEGAVRAGAMNRAQQWAEGQKWARNSDLYGALQGMPGNATQALGSSASGYGQMASTINGQQNQVNMANAMGYGQVGGMIGYGLMAKDGGYIHEGEVIRRDDEPGYAMGGRVGGMRDKFRGIVNDAAAVVGPGAEPMKGMVNSGIGQVYGSALFADGGYIEPGYAMGGMPRLGDWRDRPTTQQQEVDTPSPVGQVVGGLAPAVGMYAAKNYVAPYVKEGITALKGAITGTEAATAGTAAAEAATAGTAAAGAEAATAGSGLAGTAGLLETGGAMATGAEAAAAGTAAAEAAAAGTAVAETAAAGTAAAEAAGAASLMGPVGWAAAAGLGLYALGSGLDWWSEGGPVPKQPMGRGLRKDMRPGGDVQGPGTETSDSIPAWLSDGEYVLNAEAVKEVGKDKLEKMNEKGLKKRKAKVKPKAAPKAAGIKKPVKK